ncbi:MAG TPA: hypothetical protein VFP65_20670 [Anaeromyxobacteraceae bacterium]|nr:hypothetical protein [Anaeromyxobacteraceae bacterium]
MQAPARRTEHARLDRSALPDPAARREEARQRRMVWRVALLGAAALAIVSGSAWVLSAGARRAAALRAQATPLLDGSLGGLAPRTAPERPATSPEELAALQRSWVGSESIAPRDARVDAASGERLGAFQGFGVQVDGAEGALVLAAGRELGTAPLLASIDCRPGEPVEILVQRGGRSFSHRTRCRKDTRLLLAPDLR